MAATFVVVPAWQGSGSARALRLVDGAEAIRGDLPSASTIVVDVPLEAGESQGSGVSRFTSIQLVRDRVAMALAGVDGVAITIGGDCGVELAAVSHVADAGDIALVWFDAHGDLHTPETSSSHIFGGMVLRTLIGDGAPGLVPARPVAPENVVLVGGRELDDPELEYLSTSSVAHLSEDEVTPESLVAAIAATGAKRVYIHLDLDVLDPPDFDGLDSPVPFGLASGSVVELIKAVRAEFDVVGAGIMQFAPSSPEHAADDLGTILRIIGALAR